MILPSKRNVINHFINLFIFKNEYFRNIILKMYTEKPTCMANMFRIAEKLGFFTKIGVIVYPLLSLMQSVPLWITIHNLMMIMEKGK